MNRSTLTLAAIVALVVGYVYVFEYKKPEQEKTIKEEQQKIFKVKQDDMTAVYLKWAGGETKLQKKEGVWWLLEPIEDATDEASVNTLLKNIEDEASTAIVSEDPAADLKIYGLNDPLGFIEVTSADGKTRKVEFGQVDGLGGSKYARIVSENKIVVVDSAIQHKFIKTARDFRDKRIVRLNSDVPVTELVVRWRDKERNFTAKLQKKDTTWSYEGKSWDTDVRVVDAFISQIEGLRTNEFMPELKTAASARAKYKLNQILAQFQLKTKDGAAEELYFHSIDDGKAYVTVASRPTIYQLLVNSIEPLRINANHFRDKKKPFNFATDKVERIEIRTELSKLSLVKDGTEWKEEKPDEKYVVDQSKVSQLMSSLQGMLVSDYLGEAVKKNFSQTLGSVTLKGKDGVEFEIKWGRELSAKDRLVLTNKVNEGLAVGKSLIASLPLQTLRQQKEEKKAAE